MTTDTDSDFTVARRHSEPQNSNEKSNRRVREEESRDLRELKKLIRDGIAFMVKIGAPVAPLAVQQFVLPPSGREELEWLAILLDVPRGRLRFPQNLVSEFAPCRVLSRPLAGNCPGHWDRNHHGKGRACPSGFG
jgi:hypothetical protein